MRFCLLLPLVTSLSAWSANVPCAVLLAHGSGRFSLPVVLKPEVLERRRLSNFEGDSITIFQLSEPGFAIFKIAAQENTKGPVAIVSKPEPAQLPVKNLVRGVVGKAAGDVVSRSLAARFFCRAAGRVILPPPLAGILMIADAFSLYRTACTALETVNYVSDALSPIDYSPEVKAIARFHREHRRDESMHIIVGTRSSATAVEASLRSAANLDFE